MATSQVFTSKNMNGNDVINVGKIQVIADASEGSELVRKSQAESIAANSVQSQLVSNAGNASATTAYTSQFTQTALNTKQPNMSIDATSTGFLEIVDGSRIKLKSLGINTTYRDTTHSTLADFITAATFNGDGTITIGGEVLDKMTFIFLTTATLPQEKSIIYLGTNNGDATDFVKFGVNYNEGEIRSFFNSTGVGILFDTNTGVFSLDIGTTASELGAQSLPHGCSFTTISPNSDIKDALLKLEALINAVDQSGADGTAAVTTRINNLTGVTGNNYGTFTGSSLPDNQNGKQLFQATETLMESATSDRAAIRSEFAAADTTLQNNITAEAASRVAADNALTVSITNENTRATGAEATLTSSLNSEIVRATAAEDALDVRLDVVEGVGAGSVAKAQSDAQIYAAAAVLVEKNRALSAESALDTKIDNLAESDIVYVGLIVAGQLLSIRADRIAAGDTRNGLNIKDVAIKAGEVFVVDVAQTVTFDDASTIVGQVGDKLMATETVTAGGVDKLDFNITQADGSAITVANIGSTTIELNGSDQLDIVADSVGRTQLDAAIEADIDDKVSLTTANTKTSDGDTHFVSSSATGAQQNIYNKREQTSSDPLTGTARTVLTELHVSSDGSGNPAAPSYAHATTVATHYKGACTDLSMIIAGGNFEGNGKAGTATQATGIYGTATQAQLGINVGGTFVADNAAVSNIGVFGFSDTDGVGKDRGGMFAVSDLDFLAYSAYRVGSPIPELDAAVIADAESATGAKALVAIGDSVFRGGSITVPSASADAHATNLGDIKTKQRVFEFDLVDGVAKVITVSGINLDKSILQTTDDNQSVDVSVVRDSLNNEVTVTATGGNLTDVRLLIQELSCDVTQA